MSAIAYPPLDAETLDPLDFTATPWTAPDDTQWIYGGVSKPRWAPYNPGGGGDVAGDTLAAASKTTPVDADLIPLVDSAASNTLKKLSWANLKETLATYFGSVYAAASHAHGNITAAGAIGSAADRPVKTTTGGVLATGSFGTTSGTFAEGDDLPALEFPGLNPNDYVTITGITTPGASNPLALGSAGTVNGFNSYGPGGAGWLLSHDGGSYWLLIKNGGTDYQAQLSSAANPPDGLVMDAPIVGTGTATIDVSIFPAAFVGQWCKAETAWWQWNGTAWVAVFNLDGTPRSHTHVSADVTDATSAATPAKIVLRGANGQASFGDAGNSFSGTGVSGLSYDGYGVSGVSTLDGIGVYGESSIGAGVYGLSASGAGIQGVSTSGDNHAAFGDSGDNRSFIERVGALFGWWRGSYKQTLGAAATLTADRAVLLPDAGGTVVLNSSGNLAAPGNIGATTPATGAFTTLTTSSTTAATDVSTASVIMQGGFVARKACIIEAAINLKNPSFASLHAASANSEGWTFSSKTLFTGTQEATSAATGGLWTQGGIGVTKSIWVTLNGTFGGTLAVTGITTATGGIVLGTKTVGTLPTASSNTYLSLIVTDSLAPVLSTTVAAGGSAKAAVRSNGTNWIVTEVL